MTDTIGSMLKIMVQVDINDPKGWLTDDDKQVIADTWSKLQSGEIKDYLPEDIQ